MKKTSNLLVALALAICMGSMAFFAACSNGSDSPVASFPIVTPSKTVYKATDSFTEYTQKTLAKLAYSDFPESSVTNEDLVPDIFAARAVDANETWYLSDDKIKLAIRTCLAGKTILLGAPSVTGVAAFGARVVQVLEKEENEDLQAESELNLNSLNHMLNQFIAQQIDSKSEEREASASYEQKDYDAVAFRDGQVYFVHDIDEVYGDPASTAKTETETVERTTTDEAKDKVPGSQTHTDPSQGVLADYSALEADSIEKFVKWLKGEDGAVSRSLDFQALVAEYPQISALAESVAKDPSRKAQSYKHNFTASAGWGDRKENVEVLIDVWAYCEIDQQKDWYYVRTSVMCNNQQLNFKNYWDDNKTLTPYFDNCEIVTNFAKNRQEVRTNDCKPQTMTGSTDYSTGISIGLTGNIGLGGSGASGGVAGGVTWSDSKTTHVPDISVSFLKNGKNRPDWTFTGAKPTPKWNFLVTECDSPPAISTSKMAQFDTLSVFTLPSDYAYSKDTVELDTFVFVTLNRLSSYLNGFANAHIVIQRYPKTTNIHYTDYVKKPCNAKADYIMYFDAPAGSTPERIDLFTRELKEVVPDWNGSKKTLYAVGSANLGKVAKAYFTTIKSKIKKNKAVLKSKGFSGKFTFRIKDSDSDTDTSTFNFTF